jgi:hypothetical protein
MDGWKDEGSAGGKIGIFSLPAFPMEDRRIEEGMEDW